MSNKDCPGGCSRIHGNKGKKPTKKQLEALRKGREALARKISGNSMGAGTGMPVNVGPRPDLDINFDQEQIHDRLPGINDLITDVKLIVRDAWGINELGRPATYQDGAVPVNNYDDQDYDGTLFKYRDLETSDDFLVIDDKLSSSGPKFSDKKPLMDVITDFNTMNFFATKTTRTNFIYLSNLALSTMTQEMSRLGLGNKIDVMFKGGTTMRILVKELVRNFTLSVENYLNELIKKSVKLSDYDFEVVTQAHLPESVMSKINMISYLVVLRIRNYLEQYPVFYFDFFKLTEQAQQKKISQLKDKLQNVIDAKEPDSFFYGCNIDFMEYKGECTDSSGKRFDINVDPKVADQYQYISSVERSVVASESGAKKESTCRTDFAIVIDRNARNPNIGVISAFRLLYGHYNLPASFSTLAKSSRSKGSRFYATHNPLIQWMAILGGKDQKRIKFALNRIKYNYTIYFTKNGQRLKLDLPGEVLDVSHAHNDDRKKVKFDRPIPELNFLQRYNFINNDLDYLSYNLEGHISDIASIIFLETGYQPWVDHKYAKRIQRIIIIASLLYFNQPSGTYIKKLNNMKHITEEIKQSNGTKKYKILKDRHVVMDKLAHDIIHSINNGLKSSDPEVRAHTTEFKATCIKTFNQIYKAFLNQYHSTRNQVISYDTKGISTSPLNIEYPNVY